MAKPRIFISSTYYDLRHIRNSLEAFIETFGYDPVLFESGDIPFHPELRIDESCYSEIANCHILVLIIGGRYGSAASSDKKLAEGSDLEKHYYFYNSITKREYETAKNRPIPIFIFVEKGVLSEYQTYKNNKENSSIRYAHVENVSVFKLLDEIIAQPNNNFVRGFEVFDDISTWLRDQWAGLFAEYLTKKQADATLKTLASQIGDLSSVAKTLKEYSESMIRKVAPDESEKIISTQRKRLRHSQVMRFSREPMIEYLKDRVLESIPALTIFRAFEAAADIEDFLKRSNAPAEKMKEFLDQFKDKAERDFIEYKRRYFEVEEG